MTDTEFNLSLFVNPVDKLDSNDGKGTMVTIPLEEMVPSPEDLQNCECKGSGCKECEWVDGVVLFGKVSEDQAKYLKVPFAYYALLPNKWKDVDDQVGLYAFKYQIKPKTDEQYSNSSNGMKMLIMNGDKCMYLREGNTDDTSAKKSELQCIFFFNDGALSSVALIIKKMESKGLGNSLDDASLSALVEKMKL